MSHRCIVCDAMEPYTLFDPGPQPLTTICIPSSEQEAMTASKHCMRHVLCSDCGHIYNIQFTPEVVDYVGNWQMYNHGGGWRNHCDQRAYELTEFVPLVPGDTVMEIGCGEGTFLREMASYSHWKQMKYIGIDPSEEYHRCHDPNDKLDFVYKLDYADPETDIPAYRPGLIIMRHVLEHFPQPAAFIAELVQACQHEGIRPYLFIEVPNGDLILDKLRFQDMIYEHVSQFTTTSLERLLQKDFRIIKLEKAYRGGVLTALCQLRTCDSAAKCARQFLGKVNHQIVAVSNDLHSYVDGGRELAFWGAIGKSVSFFNFYGVNKIKFPVVVDSNPEIVGMYVPGTGQRIRDPKVLLTSPVDTIVVTSSWRVDDIALQIKALGIQCDEILYANDGKLQVYEGVYR